MRINHRLGVVLDFYRLNSPSSLPETIIPRRGGGEKSVSVSYRLNSPRWSASTPKDGLREVLKDRPEESIGTQFWSNKDTHISILVPV